MFEEMTPAVLRALEAAGHYAWALGEVEIGPVAVVMALLEEEEGQAALLARAAGLDLAALQRPSRPEPGSTAPGLPLSQRVREGLQGARDVARELDGEATVTSVALFLWLVQSDEVVQRMLTEQGLSLARLDAYRQQSRTAPPTLETPLDLADPTERVDLHRILDAAGNRAREACRVIEDYCRFILDDSFLSSQIKQFRHDLATLLADVGNAEQLQARETLRDVGITLSTETELQRVSILDVARINLGRLQEALRSLEEWAKLDNKLLSQALEQLRYRSYTLEKAIVLGASARQRLRGVRVQALLSRRVCSAALDWTIAEAAAGGVGLVQLREKNVSDRELVERAREVRRWTRQAGILFVINDRPDIARLVEADGVHLGQDDLPVKEARRILGSEALIGVSTHDLSQVRQAILDGASYLGVGPIFPSATKEFANFPGLDFLREAVAETSLPLFAIGGITTATIAQAAAAGARRVAVSHTIASADDPRLAAATLIRALPEL
jgi:thiamine-phosphate pyrophosphorylase